MKRFLCIFMLGLIPSVATAAEKPMWAFPATDKVLPATQELKPPSAPGSAKTYTRAQIDDPYAPPDWYPDAHPPMPPIVAGGNKATEVRACALCHLPSGTGHDESANLAGMPAAYIVGQIAEYKSGRRKGVASMIAIAAVISDAEVAAAADYFASLKARAWVRVVETKTVAKTYIDADNNRLRLPGGGTESLDGRIIEVPEDEDAALNRDPSSGFIAYVPIGSIKKGAALVDDGGGKTVSCFKCHGPELRGKGEAPPIAGRQATYIVRQLWDFQNGDRVGDAAVPMKAMVEKLSLDDMVALAAYTASLTP